MFGTDQKAEQKLHGRYDTALICSNGHVITNSIERHPASYSDYCSECGERTTAVCLNCKAKIRGFIETPGWRVVPYKLPLYCYSCGKPYDWTYKKVTAAKEYVDLIDDLSDSDKVALKKDIESLSHNSPQAQVVAAKFNILLKKAPQKAAQTLRELVIEITDKQLRHFIEAT